MEVYGLLVFLLPFTLINSKLVERYFRKNYEKKNFGTFISDGLLNCGFKCNQVKDCSRFMFNPSDKSCEVMGDSGPNKDVRNLWVSECPPPPTVENTRITTNSTLPGGRAVYTCPELHKWRGGNECTCLPQLFWSPIGICYRYKWENKNETFTTSMPFGLPTNSVITIVGKTMSNESFSFVLWQNMLIGQLYIRGLFDYNDKQRVVEYGEKIDQSGEDFTIPSKDFPFSPDKKFVMGIVVEAKQFKVTVDKKKLFIFNNTYNSEDITFLTSNNLEIIDMTFKP